MRGKEGGRGGNRDQILTINPPTNPTNNKTLQFIIILALKLSPEDHLLYANRAQAYLKLKEPQKAEEDAKKSIDLDPYYVKVSGT